jgi:hypothetical protein
MNAKFDTTRCLSDKYLVSALCKATNKYLKVFLANKPVTELAALLADVILESLFRER